MGPRYNLSATRISASRLEVAWNDFAMPITDKTLLSITETKINVIYAVWHCPCDI